MSEQNDLMLRVLRGEKVSRTPVWMMRQAGRYLPEYRATREQAGSFMDLCRNADLACEVTLQPLRRYALDAAILFSDILTIPDAMGLGLEFIPGRGPVFAKTVRSEADVDGLPFPQMDDELAYVMNAVRTIRSELNGKVPLIGFSGSPWTLATYMVEGQSSREFAQAKTLAYQQPEVMHALLAKLTQSVTDYLNAQIAAGAQIVMIFDTWGGALPHWAYPLFSLDYMKNIVAGLNKDSEGNRVPAMLFTKGGGQWLHLMKDSGAQGLGLDWTTSLASARKMVGEDIVLQGNLDPGMLRANPATIHSEVQRVLSDYGMGHRHIFNLGHGITPDIPPDHVSAFIDAVHEISPAYHE
ncbi:uroporphyrinogen decarboxylase [Suttonella sp. R2A3]|uniref:uroporphyrinogen decarboxylase n=1 Tax=Suttonella sp. R2A3 TaxID=2908648 RepID=UPI001F36E3C6|nr:uroporphyrinogen decarboxylase [Suttonella sp. R2A3]UJF23725.1 uroporphyrinogen decarboxylase [Suttonella sp. R2A3]